MAYQSLKETIRISSVDSRGRTIAPEVVAVANEISGRALHFAERALGDPAVALSLLEESAALVSRVLAQNRNGNHIRDLEAYIFRAFLRLVTRVRQRQVLLIEQLSTRLPRPGGLLAARKLELEVMVNELLTRSDALTRDMFYRRVEGYSWKEIGRAHGISAHTAESRFSRAVSRLRRNLRS